MAIKDLFKSDKERKRDQEKTRRRAFREAETALDSVKDRGRKLQQERDKQWTQAREYLKGGQKGAAQRCVQSVRSNELLMHKLQQKQWVFTNLLTKLELAKSDQEFSESLRAITTVVNIDPEQVDDVLAEVEHKLGEQGATDKIWDRMHTKEMEGVEGALTDSVPSLEDLMSDLSDEVADAQVEEAPVRKSKGERAASSDDTARLRERLRKVIDSNK